MTKQPKGEHKSKEKTPPEEGVLTEKEFFRILDKVIRPVNEKKQEKPPKPEKKGTSE